MIPSAVASRIVECIATDRVSSASDFRNSETSWQTPAMCRVPSSWTWTLPRVKRSMVSPSPPITR